MSRTIHFRVRRTTLSYRRQRLEYAFSSWRGGCRICGESKRVVAANANQLGHWANVVNVIVTQGFF